MSSSTLRHLARLRARYGVEVRVTRNGNSLTLDAVPAKSTAKVVGGDGSFSVLTIDDWLIAVCDWPRIDDIPYPLKGDEISVGGIPYIVTHPDQNTPVFSNFNQLDRPAVVWRVHSMQN